MCKYKFVHKTNDNSLANTLTQAIIPSCMQMHACVCVWPVVLMQLVIATFRHFFSTGKVMITLTSKRNTDSSLVDDVVVPV